MHHVVCTVQQVPLSLLSFILRSMSIFLTRDYGAPVGGLRTRDEDCWSIGCLSVLKFHELEVRFF